MVRQLTTLSVLIALCLAACAPVATPVAPAEATTPTAEVEIVATAVPQEAEITATETVTATVETAVEAVATTGCLEPSAETQLISSPAAGYCFLIPVTFSRSDFSDAEGFNLGIYGPGATGVQFALDIMKPLCHLEVIRARGV